MEATVPVEVGTRGSVRSLVMKEIEYFSKLELDCHGSFTKPQEHVVNLAPSSGNSWPSFGFRVMTCRRKKRRGSGFLPSICSQVEVADSHQLNGIAGFSYRNLKADVKKFEGVQTCTYRVSLLESFCCAFHEMNFQDTGTCQGSSVSGPFSRVSTKGLQELQKETLVKLATDNDVQKQIENKKT